MPLVVSNLIQPFRLTMSRQNPSSDIFGQEIGTALEAYVKPILNITGGQFINWASPTQQIVSACRILNQNYGVLAAQLGTIIQTSFRTIYTRNQLRIELPEGTLTNDFSIIFSKLNTSSDVLATEMATSIHKFASLILITSLDVTSGGAPITGPIL